MDRRPTDYPRTNKPKFGWRDDNGKPIHAINDAGTPICGRRNNKTKLPCKQEGWRLCPNGRCPAVGHGGKNPGPGVKHGRTSAFLPTRLAAHYEEIIKDDVLAVVRENIAILASLIRDKAKDMGPMNGGQLWKLAVRHVAALRKAYDQGNTASVAEALAALENTLAEGKAVQAKESDLADLMKKAGDLSNVEIKRLDKMGRFMTAEQMMANMAAVVSILKKHVEPNILARVSADLGILATQKIKRSA